MSNEAQSELAAIEAELRDLETVFEMTSERFYELWIAHSLSDTHAFNGWSILIQARRGLLARMEAEGKS